MVHPAVAAPAPKPDTGGMDDLEYRERLAHDVASWEREGLIQPAQSRAILARAGAGEPKAVGALRLGWLITAVSVIGALVLGAGVILLIGTNWDEIPDGLRAAMIIGSMLASYGAAYALMYRFDMQRIGSALLLLGYLIYVAGVFLLPQIYNMPVDNPILILLAAAGAYPLAYAFESRIVLLAGIGVTLAWVIAELSTRYPETPEAQAAMIVIGAFGVALYAVGRAHALRRALERYGEMYMLAGFLITMGLMFVFSWDAVWDEIIRAEYESFAAPPIVYVACALAALLTIAQWFARGRGAADDIEAVAMLLVLATGTIVATWPASSGYSLVFAVLYFAIAAGVVTRGYLTGDERQINIGLLVVALGLLTRYIDWFWDVTSDAAFFMAGGALLLGVAFGLERLRRHLLAGMPSDDAPPPAGADALEAVR